MKKESKTSKVFYICIVDEGGKLATCPNMAHHTKQAHLIKVDRLLSNEEVCRLLKTMAKTRIAPKIVGVWEDGQSVINYNELNLTN